MSIYVREGYLGALHGLGDSSLSAEAMRMTRIVTGQTSLLTQALTQRPVSTGTSPGPGMFEDPAAWGAQQAEAVPTWAWVGVGALALVVVGGVIYKIKKRRG